MKRPEWEPKVRSDGSGLDHATDPFERFLKYLDNARGVHGMADALVFVNDTMEAALRICETKFGEGNYTAEHALRVYDRIVEQYQRSQAGSGSGEPIEP